MRVIAIVNQKGGCGKTTSTVNLAGSLAADGSRVLVVDLDPQAHATLALGIDPEELEENLYEILTDPGGADRIHEVLVQAGGGVAVAPSGIVLSALEQKLAVEAGDVKSRTERVANALEGLRDSFDYVLIDCPPNVGLLTFNALRAASEVIIPLETSYFSIYGVQKLLETIALLSERIGHELSVRVLPTMYDGRTRYARQTLAEIRELRPRAEASRSVTTRLRPTDRATTTRWPSKSRPRTRASRMSPSGWASTPTRIRCARSSYDSETPLPAMFASPAISTAGCPTRACDR
jgi:chromosome partitioning protein